ncbi:drug resistance transporter, EmrB/QacA subfamily [Nocardia farcinica]|uniref:Spectinomycin tetracycline efflux pump n=1 Tax=Nocardia farcinica TaxID=37329 RepID=A0A0H5NJL1_NOCFR|nr:Spectinomycin tetracycline efflux pump [Nocardia farcinica]SIS70100.1 drug resistance transporter, EmrB/QacA subfamily [Nocardia farcinica]
MVNIVYHRSTVGTARVVLFVTCAAQFLVVLDGLIVTIALPDMARDLGLSAAGQQWVLNGYLLTFGGLLLLAGRAGDVFGHRRVFLYGAAVSTVAVLVAGVAGAAWLLIAARFAQGVGAAALAPSTLSLLVTTFAEPERRRHAVAIWAAVSATAGVLGFVLGGAITALLGWRWVLLVNVPLGVVVLATAAVGLPVVRPVERARLDVTGAVAVTGGAGALILGLAHAAEHGWGTARVLLALSAAVILFGLAVVVEQRVPAPLLPLPVLGRRGVATGVAIMALFGGVMNATVYFLSLYHQQVLGYGPLRTGAALLPMSAVILVGSLASRTLLPRCGARLLVVAGSLVAAVALVWMARLPESPGYVVHVLGPTMVWAAGVGVLTMPIVELVTGAVGPQLAGLGSGLVNMARHVGGAVGLAGLVTVVGTVADGGGSAVRGYNAALLVAAGLAAGMAVLGLLTEDR